MARSDNSTKARGTVGAGSAGAAGFGVAGALPCVSRAAGCSDKSRRRGRRRSACGVGRRRGWASPAMRCSDKSGARPGGTGRGASGGGLAWRRCVGVFAGYALFGRMARRSGAGGRVPRRTAASRRRWRRWLVSPRLRRLRAVRTNGRGGSERAARGGGGARRCRGLAGGGAALFRWPCAVRTNRGCAGAGGIAVGRCPRPVADGWAAGVVAVSPVMRCSDKCRRVGDGAGREQAGRFAGDAPFDGFRRHLRRQQPAGSGCASPRSRPGRRGGRRSFAPRRPP